MQVRHAGQQRRNRSGRCARGRFGARHLCNRSIVADVDADVFRPAVGKKRALREEPHVRPYDTLWINARLATMVPGSDAFGTIDDGAIASRDGRIAWIGPGAALPAAPETLADMVIDVGRRWITPGLIDPHTHLIFGGNRLGDFERRIAGEGYAAAAQGGSGIAYTVAQTRAASDEELFAAARPRLDDLIASGATTVEIKSGYGLDVETEMRMLRVARRLGEACGITVRTTYLGAHTIPPEYAAARAAYITLICEDALPRIAAAGLADAVDIFCETVAITPEETARVIEAARAAGLPVKLHADQLTDSGGAAIAARAHALSADHLEYASDDGIAALAAGGTVAVVLPGAYYYLQEKRAPPLAALRRHGVPIALASDCNPGTSPVASLTAVLNLGCVLFGLTPAEALAALTRNAARALGLADRGELRTGLRCDLALWDVAAPGELCYWLGRSVCAGTVVGGKAHAAS
jgi:imidazolonepropionase